jgi:hypothetical protein
MNFGQNLMKEMGIETKITLKHIVLGYKIDDKNYLALIVKQKKSLHVINLQYLHNITNIISFSHISRGRGFDRMVVGFTTMDRI